MAIPYYLSAQESSNAALERHLDEMLAAKPKVAPPPMPRLPQRPAPAPAAMPAPAPAAAARNPLRQAQQQAASRKAAAERERRAAESSDGRAPADAGPCLDERALAERDGGGQGDGGDGQDGEYCGQDGDPMAPGGAPRATGSGAALQASLDAADAASDAEALAGLLPHDGASGIFEVLLPNGDTLGVAVDATPERVSYLLQPGSEALAARIRKQKMELGAHLERRIGRSVSLTVL